MVRPKEKALGWGWSGTERLLFNFFLGIYSPRHPNIDQKETSVADLFYYWDFPRTEARIVAAWLQHPFRF
jgi:hypothetical protein